MSSFTAINRTLLASWGKDAKGRVLLTGWAAVFAGVTLRAYYVRRLAKKQLALAAPPAAAAAPPAKKAPRGPTALSRVRRLAVPRWGSRPVAWCLLLTTGIGFRLLVQIRTSQMIGELGSLLAARNWPALYRRQLSYALWAVPAALFAALQKFAAGNAALAMRANLTAELHERYAGAASLTTSLSSVEDGAASSEEGVARGTADVDAYCTQAVATFESLLKPSVEAVLISGKLASMMGPRQFFAVFGFFGGAGSWVRMVAPAFATLTAAKAAADGALLAQRSWLHAHAEEVTTLSKGARIIWGARTLWVRPASSVG